MSVFHRNNEKRRIYHEFRRQEEEVIGSLCRLGSRPISPKTQLEQEKRIRREIANSNERRRMQSINSGFQSLRNLLPHHEGEKLSKAAILQHTSEFIYQLEQEKTRLLSQNCQLKRLLNQHMNNQDSDGSSLDSPLPKRKKPENNVHVEEVNLWKTPLDIETRCLPSATQESSDEGFGHMSPPRHCGSQESSTTDHLQKELLELRLQLEQERSLRVHVEKKTLTLEAQLYSQDKKLLADEPSGEHSDHYEHCSAEYSPIDKCSELFSEQRVPSPGLEESKVKEEEDDEMRVMSLVESEDASTESEPHDLSAKGPLCSLSATMLPSPPSSILEETPSVVVVIRPAPEHKVSQEECKIKEEREESSDTKDETADEESAADLDFHSQCEPVYPASTSRQNLETIVEAIRHLEGDHLFLDDPQEEVLVQSEVQEVPSRSAALACGGHEYAIRQQVIHCSVARPGVIVANHS